MKRLLLILFMTLAFALPSKATMLADIDLEEYPVDGYCFADNPTYHDPRHWYFNWICDSYRNFTIVDAPTRAGNRAVNFYRDGPLGNAHSMWVISDPANGGALLYDMGSEYWFSFSVYIPSDFPTSGQSWRIVWQWWETAGGCGNPPVNLRIEDDQWGLVIRGDDQTPCEQPYEIQTNCYFGSVAADKGSWIDWAINWVPDSTGVNGGKVALYKDGVQIDLSTLSCTTPVLTATYTGKVGYAAVPAAVSYTTLGIYQYDGPTPNNLIFDEIKVGDSAESLASMSPDVGPVPDIDDTPDPSNIDANTLSVQGTATHTIGVTDCKWRRDSPVDASNNDGNCTADDGTFNGVTEDFTCATDGYSQGVNTLYVGCTDAEANWGNDLIVVNFDSVVPTVTAKVIQSSGTVFRVTFSEAVWKGASYADAELNLDFTAGTGAPSNDITLTYTEIYGGGTGTNTWYFTIGETIPQYGTVNFDLSATANVIEDHAKTTVGNDLAQITDDATDNQSAQGSPPTARTGVGVSINAIAALDSMLWNNDDQMTWNNGDIILWNE